jgi:hypothetical protein
MDRNTRRSRKANVDSNPIVPLPGQAAFEFAQDGAGGPKSPDVRTAVDSDDPGNGRIDPTTIGIPPALEPSLRSRIDPAAIAVDWDVEALADEHEEGLDAKWGRPPRDNFVRAHSTWTTGVYLLDCRDSLGMGAEYVLAKDVARRVIEEDEPVGRVQVYLLTDRDGGLRYWPVKLGDASELETKPSDHVKTALAAVERARHEWVKIVWRSQKGVNGWRARKARIDIPEPTWPDDPMALFLQVVGDRYINDPNDKVILKYLGEA